MLEQEVCGLSTLNLMQKARARGGRGTHLLGTADTFETGFYA